MRIELIWIMNDFLNKMIKFILKESTIILSRFWWPRHMADHRLLIQNDTPQNEGCWIENRYKNAQTHTYTQTNIVNHSPRTVIFPCQFYTELLFFFYYIFFSNTYSKNCCPPRSRSCDRCRYYFRTIYKKTSKKNFVYYLKM